MEVGIKEWKVRKCGAVVEVMEVMEATECDGGDGGDGTYYNGMCRVRTELHGRYLFRLPTEVASLMAYGLYIGKLQR